jgi:UMF1 family MFS transporter
MKYPLHGLPNQRNLWAWISYDVANQSFTLIINTLLFAIFFGEVVVRNAAVDDRYWALTYGSSMLLAAVLSPWLGAVADERGLKKFFLIGSGWICALLTCALGWIQPGQVGLAMALYIPANLAYQLGENFLSSFLPSLAPPEKMGRVSGFSWACAYSSAFLLLVLTAAGMVVLHLAEPSSWRPFFVLAGLWYVAFAIPSMLWLREPAFDRKNSGHNLLVVGFSRLAATLRDTAKYPDLALLLVASLFYGTGMNVVIFFSGKLAAEYGFNQLNLVLFVAVITVSGIVGTLLPMAYQDRFGHRRSTLALLGLWLFTACVFSGYAYLHETFSVPNWPLWVIGNLLGFGLGALGSANRAFVGYLAPPGKEGEIFGIWGLTYKVSAILTYPFAWVRDAAGSPAALLVLAGFILVGLLLTLPIDEQRGRRAL